jgi:hypothetical protein
VCLHSHRATSISSQKCIGIDYQTADQGPE